MAYFSFEGVEIYYEEIGSGRPVLLLHGLGGNLEAVKDVFAPPAGIRLLTLDFPGHGKSGYCTDDIYCFRTFARLVNAFLEHLNIEKAILGGISMGAGTALNFALQYPEKTEKLCLIRPAWLAGPMGDEVLHTFRTVYELLKKPDREMAYRNSELCRKLNETYPAIARSFNSFFDSEEKVRTAEKFLKMPADAPVEKQEDYASVACPTIVIATDKDFIHPLDYGKQTAKWIPNAMFYELVSKSVNAKQFAEEIQRLLEDFFTAGRESMRSD